MAKNIQIKGLKKLLKDLDNLDSEATKQIAATTEKNANQIELDAKSKSPVDTGKLRQGINAIEISPLNWKIQANTNNIAPYSAYMEFGTGGLVDVPEELKDVAIKFKGKGVKQINLLPRPYLYPAFVKGRKQYIEDLKDDLEDLTKKI